MKKDRVAQVCITKLKYQCPNDWDSLEPQSEPGPRHCQMCNELVYLCESDAEMLSHAEQGHCIAWEIPQMNELPKMVLGQPDAEWLRKNHPTPAQLAAQKKAAIAGAIAGALSDQKYTSRRCQNCHYPFPSWYGACRVCGGTAFFENPPAEGGAG
jgi:hypothetical protein